MSNYLNNPFVRGFSDLSIQRLLAIHYEFDHPLAYRSLHPSQAHLKDAEVDRFPCVFCDDFALITEGQTVPEDLDAQCNDVGVVRSVVYAILAKDDDQLRHVGDLYSEEEARDVVRRLRFETGHYSRAFEISSIHLSVDARLFLIELVDAGTTIGFLFVAFRIPHSNAIGLKLLGTPWTDEHLEYVDGTTAAELRGELLAQGVPESLIDVLFLAAIADVRLLIIDDDAQELEGLPRYTS